MTEGIREWRKPDFHTTITPDIYLHNMQQRVGMEKAQERQAAFTPAPGPDERLPSEGIP